MPRVINPRTGKARHFAYSPQGLRSARVYARATGGRVDMGSLKDNYKRKK